MIQEHSSAEHVNLRGVIASKNDEKGFGFITPDGKESTKQNNLFFFGGELEGLSFADLKVGEAVIFEEIPSKRGPRAIGIKRA